MSQLNLEELTKINVDYRHVIQTIPGLFQLVLMSLQPYEDIPMEKHEGIQFIKVEEGSLYFEVEEKKFTLNAGDSLTVPPYHLHMARNQSYKDVKFYSIYVPPEHDPNRIDRRQYPDYNI
jgi:mannose-6-phosphate isomerase-like protein (cupin superfamily)